MRHIQVDIAKFITLPVQVTLEGDQIGSPGEIPLMASTRLYLWRARNVTGDTDEQAQTELESEVLSLTETRYVFQVEPTIIDGVYYEQVRAGGSDPAARRDLGSDRQHTRFGEVWGDPRDRSPLRMVRQRERWRSCSSKPRREPSRSVTTAPDGTFSSAICQSARTTSLPIRTCWQKKDMPFQTHIDLTDDQDQTVNVNLDASPGRECAGTVMDDQGKVVPFAWISPATSGQCLHHQPRQWCLPLMACHWNPVP